MILERSFAVSLVCLLSFMQILVFIMFRNLVVMIVTVNGPAESMSSGTCGQRRPRSASVSVQSDQSLHSSLTSLNTTECIT